MKSRYGMFSLVALSLCLAGTAFANKVAGPESSAELANPTCDQNGYKVESQIFSAPVNIADNGQAFAVIGTIPTPNDGDVLLDVMVEATMAHTWVGDLIMKVDYVLCGSSTPLASATLLCRPRGTNALVPAPCGTGTGFGASGNLGAAGTAPSGHVPYIFSSDAPAQISDGVNPATVPTGCYKSNTPLAVFAGLPKGGCFVLSAGDWAGGDLGYVTAWRVLMTNDRPVPTASRTWGQIKTSYR